MSYRKELYKYYRKFVNFGTSIYSLFKFVYVIIPNCPVNDFGIVTAGVNIEYFAKGYEYKPS